ncbi:MAG: hypothetical protein DU430_01335 [Candidatus Tokpelaia sp.]|nr:MAG: hypothetical protein DU430_01335 [Candidatus Tokpelaia sp.]
MKKILVTLCLLLAGTGLSSADFLDKGVSYRPNRINPFVSQQMVKPPVEQKSFSQKARAYQMQPLLSRKIPAEALQLRPGRNYDNPAANRFGDGSQPNKYIWGSHR